MIDPAYRFTVVYNDGEELSQEDEKGYVVRDHCHIRDKDDVEIYSLRNRPGDHVVSVNYTTGIFSINDQPLIILRDDFDFMNKSYLMGELEKIWGRRIVGSFTGKRTYFYCGWKTIIENKEYKSVIYVSEQGEVMVEADSCILTEQDK